MSVKTMEDLRNLSQQASERISNKGDESTSAAPSAPDAVETASEADASGEAASASSDEVTKEIEVEKPGKEAPAASTDGKPVIGGQGKSPSLGNAATAAIAAAAASKGGEWKPSFKYKVDRVEKDVPEFLRAAIKDEATEKQVRELLERGEGIEQVKTRYKEVKDFAAEIHQRHTRLNEGLSEMGAYIKKNDFGSFFDVLGVPREQIYKWVLEEARIQQLPPEQREHILAARQAQQDLEVTQRQSQSYESALVEQANKTRLLELRFATAQPAVKSFSETFDAKVGKPGSFEAEVAAFGKKAWDEEGVDLTPDEAIQRVMQHYGRFFAQTGQSDDGASMGQPAAALGTGAAPVVGAQPAPKVPAAVNAKPPVIPTIQGGQTSPTKSKPKSLADLKKLSHEASARIAQRQA